jgi:hypothetical protein
MMHRKTCMSNADAGSQSNAGCFHLPVYHLTDTTLTRRVSHPWVASCKDEEESTKPGEKMRGMKYTAISAAILGVSMLGGIPVAHAQTDVRTGVTQFETSYFSRSQPATAYDIVILLPGLRLIEGDVDLRGYSGTGGNILIDGQRPASKGQTLEEILKRIPASAVERVELIRSGAEGVDMQGYAVMANVVRIQSGKRRGRIEVEDAFLQHGFSSPRAAAEFSSDNEGRTLDVAVAIYREIDDEHGFGIRNRYAEDGTLLRQADYEQPEGETVKELSGGYRFPLAGGSLKVNALLKDERMFADIKNDISYPLPELSTGTEYAHADDHHRPARHRARLPRQATGPGLLRTRSAPRPPCRLAGP